MKNKDLKIIGLGLALMLAGIYINLEIGLSQFFNGGSEFFIVLIGFIMVLAGVFIKD